MDANDQKGRDRLFLALFLLCISLLVLGITLSFVAKDIGPLAEIHSQFEQMQRSTGADDVLPRPLLYLIFLPLFFIFGAALLIAYTRPQSTRPTRTIVLYTLGYVFFFSAMLWTYDQASDKLFGGFPEATAWMTYAIWFFPILFIALFYLRFETWVIGPEEEEEFDQIMSNKSLSDS